jgi:hypothetical protein
MALLILRSVRVQKAMFATAASTLTRSLRLSGKPDGLLMTREEAALPMGLSAQLVDRRRGDREFPEVMVIGAGTYERNRYRRADLERWVEARRGQCAKEIPTSSRASLISGSPTSA